MTFEWPKLLWLLLLVPMSAMSWLWLLPALAVAAWFGLSGPQSIVITLGWVAVWAVLSRFHPQQQFLHDALAGTRLISSKPMSR